MICRMKALNLPAPHTRAYVHIVLRTKRDAAPKRKALSLRFQEVIWTALLLEEPAAHSDVISTPQGRHVRSRNHASGSKNADIRIFNASLLQEFFPSAFGSTKRSGYSTLFCSSGETVSDDAADCDVRELKGDVVLTRLDIYVDRV